MLSAGYREGTSYLRVLWEECFREEGQGKEVRMTFLILCFLKSFSLKYSICQGAIFWSSVS